MARLAAAASSPGIAFALLLVLLSVSFLLLRLSPCPSRTSVCSPALCPPAETLNPATTALSNLLFGVASSSRSLPRRSGYLRCWWDPGRMRGFVFLDSPLLGANLTDGLPPVRVSADTAGLPYAFRGGLRSAVRVARVVRDLVDAAEGLAGVRWVVLGDDDTVFFPENLASVLGKLDWNQWHYVGGSSESVEQNEKFSFDMAFGGGGFALSWPLARALARVLDSCLVRYAHLYGGDARVFSCLAELGVGLKKDLGFHQVDVRGDLFGMLAAHPLTPLLSLHHLDSVDPIFPGKDRLQALIHLFEAVKHDPARILQLSVCYDRSASRTVSISWGYVVQVFNGNMLLPDIITWQRTFRPWRRGRSAPSGHYMFNTREFASDPCQRPALFFLDSVVSDINGIHSNYSRHADGLCINNKEPEKLKRIMVSSHILSVANSLPLRRQCCDILPSSVDDVMEIRIRKCKNELIAMSP